MLNLPANWLSAAAPAVAVLVGLEVVLWLGSRLTRRLAPGLIQHVWAASVAVLAYVAATERAPGDVVVRAAQSACLVLTGVVLYTLFDVAVLRRPWNRKAGPLLPRLARGALGFGATAFLAFAVATWVMDVKLTALVAGSTVLTAVIGFAVQDLLKDAMSGVALQSERPFVIGDWLLIDGQPAQVIEMSWRSTHLRTTDGVHVYEPNATLAQARVHNYGRGRAVAWNLRIGLPYAAAPARAKDVLLEAARSAPGVLREPAPEVFLESFSDSSVVYRVRAWLDDMEGLNAFVDAVNSRAWYALQRAGIEFPFPTRTVHLHQADVSEQARQEDELRRIGELLSKLDLFRGLTPEALRTLAAGARREHHDAGEHLVHEGEEADSLYLLERGVVAVLKKREGREPVEVGRLNASDFFGEMSLLTGEPRSASVVAVEDSEVLVVSREALAPVLAADPSLATGLSQVLARRTAATAAALEDRRRLDQQSIVPTEASILDRIRSLFGLD